MKCCLKDSVLSSRSTASQLYMACPTNVSLFGKDIILKDSSLAYSVTLDRKHAIKVHRASG